MGQNLNYLLCSTVYVINNHREFLLVKHPKLKKWVPPGGKIEVNELPHAAALRECFEETGFQVELIRNQCALDENLFSPYGLEYIPQQGSSEAHLDFIYFARPISGSSPLAENELEIKWFSTSSISELDTFPNIIKWCEKLLEQESFVEKVLSKKFEGKEL